MQSGKDWARQWVSGIQRADRPEKPSLLQYYLGLNPAARKVFLDWWLKGEEGAGH